MISHHHKCIFVHIPKTAGQSIERAFLEQIGLDWETRAPLLLRYNDNARLGPPRLAHLTAQQYTLHKYIPDDMFNSYFKFAYVRNPWDRLVSFYKYLGYASELDFNTFAKKVFEKRIWREQYWFVRPQSDFVYTDDNRQLMNFIGKFENLQDDFHKICEITGMPTTKLAHINKSGDELSAKRSNSERIKAALKHIKNKNIPSHKHYQEYYDSESIEIANRLYHRDIELLGYRFE